VAPILATTLVNGATSALWLPIGSLGTKSGIKGALYLYANRAEQLSQEVFESTSQVARAISPAIDNSILHQQVVEQNLRLEALVKERTDQLQRVNDRLNAILSHISDGIVLVRDDGSIDVTNYAFDQKLGAAEDAYFGLPLEDIADDTDQDALRQLAADVLTDGHPRQIEITVCPKDAARFDADVSVARVLEGGQTFAICSIHDISHLKEVERLKSDFVSNVSHDLRTPVAGMLLNLSTLQGYYERLTEEKRLEKIKQAHAQVKTLAEMVDGILDLSRIEARGKARSNELVDIVAAAREIVTELEPSATAKQQHIILSTLHSEMIVPGEHGDFARIWRNLVGNATKYSPNSCSIRLHLGLMAKTNGKIHLSENLLPSQFDVPPDLNEGSYFVGQVQDEGYGIPVEDFKDLFTRFHRGWAKTGSIAGSGLGLSVVFELLKFYGGGIHVTSKPEEGSLFTFWLPGHQESRKVQV
jgi:PAS domain S-box-containing protein